MVFSSSDFAVCDPAPGAGSVGIGRSLPVVLDFKCRLSRLDRMELVMEEIVGSMTA